VSEKAISFESGECEIYGTLGLPEGPPRGGVVLVHGWGTCRMGPHRILVETARLLNERGFAALRFDLTGRGESEGDPFGTDLDRMFEDTRAALRDLRGRLPEGTPLALLGMCSGGNVSLGVVTMEQDVKAAVCWSTYPFQSQRRPAQDVKRTSHLLKDYARKLFLLETWKKFFTGRIRFGMIFHVLFGHFRKKKQQKKEQPARNPQESVRDAQIVEALGSYGGRLLFLFGGADPEAADARKMFGEFFTQRGVRAEFDEIPGANHNFYSLEWKRAVIERSVEWLAQALEQPGLPS
jgi:predicted alpha/beta-hydrolase family hydrolase